MRYSNTENTWLLGNFPSGGTVTIKIINLSTDNLETLVSNTCTESAEIDGLYKFDVDVNMTNSGYKNFAYEMFDGDNRFRGKFVYGGYVDNITDDDTQTIIDDLWSDIQILIGDPTPESDIAEKLNNLDTGLRQVLSNIADEIQENQINISKGSLKVMI
jgi:hypothetical protein